MMISDSDLVQFVDDLLSIEEIEDDSENGVQVDSSSEIEKVAFAVDVRKDTVERTIEENADLLFVHHGLIWNGLGPLTGRNYDIIQNLIRNDIGLYAAHLPLDVHPEVGNNVELARTIDAKPGESFMEYKNTEIARMAELKKEKTVESIAKTLENQLNTDTFTLKGEREVEKVGILTGKGGQALKRAKQNGADLFITGERTYTAYNEALDLDMPLIFAGHYATETLGVKNMMELIESDGYHTCFIPAQTTI